MRRSALSATWCGIALLLLSACGPGVPGTAAEKAEAAWKLYLSKPDPNTYENFIRANRSAAGEHGVPHDKVGIEYQLRALEVQASHAERTNDVRLAADVTERVGEIEARDLTGVYEESLPGAKSRLSAAKALAERISR